jgi:hypothetical protein
LTSRHGSDHCKESNFVVISALHKNRGGCLAKYEPIITMLIIFGVGSKVASHQSSNICAGQVATSVNIHNIGAGINRKLCV